MTKFTTLARPKLLMLRTHGAPIASWTLMLLGWFWLGHQGLQLGWLYASGVTPLVLWWACRIGAKQYARTHAVASSWVFCCGLGAACMLALTGLSPLDDYDFAALNAASVLWGMLLGLTEARSQSLSNQCAQSMYYPLVAAVCVAGMWFIPGAWSGIGVALAVLACVGLLGRYDRSCDTQGVSLAHARWSEQLAPMAMGLMMATVWQSHAWCAGTGWSSENNLLVHLLLMAGLPAIAHMEFGVVGVRIHTASLRRCVLVCRYVVTGVCLGFPQRNAQHKVRCCERALVVRRVCRWLRPCSIVVDWPSDPTARSSCIANNPAMHCYVVGLCVVAYVRRQVRPF